MKKFPKDCKGCENLKYFDMTVDDWTSKCKVNGMEVDDCDDYFKWYPCPLEKNIET